MRTKLVKLLATMVVLLVAFVGVGARSLAYDEGTAKISKELNGVLKNMFDAEFYAAEYPDVATAVGNDEKALFNHFTKFGIWEGRQPNAEFNVSVYASAYPDLCEYARNSGMTVGEKILFLYKHYNDCGKIEGRDITTLERASANGIKVTNITINDETDWSLILVNKSNPIPAGYTVKLAKVSGKMQCDSRVKSKISAMINGAKKDNISLIICSAYRTQQTQETLFAREVNTYVTQGIEYTDAYNIAATKVAIPGTSEHQIGLAFDIVTPSHRTLDFEFADTDAGIWLREHCAEYGFILRYPLGKEGITDIEYEPWHFRYVGVEAATYIMNNGLTLEEYLSESEK